MVSAEICLACAGAYFSYCKYKKFKETVHILFITHMLIKLIIQNTVVSYEDCTKAVQQPFWGIF